MTVATTYTNSLSYIQFRNEIEANRLGYINSILYGASFMKVVPIVPANDFMQDIYYTRKQLSTRRSQKRVLNEELAPGVANPFEKKTELTAIYSTTPTSIDWRLAEKDPTQFDTLMQRDAEDLIPDIDYDIINGTPDASGRGIVGLKTRIPIGHATLDVNNGATVAISSSATTMKTFLRMFRAAVQKVKRAPGMQIACFCSERIYLAIQAGRDQLGANVIGVGIMDIMNERVITVDGIPLIVCRQDSAGSEIFAFDENGETSTSMFLVGYGGGAGEGTYKLPQGMVILSSDGVIGGPPPYRTGTQIQAVQEIDIGLRVPDRSVIRISRLLE